MAGHPEFSVDGNMGYEMGEVDEYVRDVEAQLAELRKICRSVVQLLNHTYSSKDGFVHQANLVLDAIKKAGK